MKGKRMRVLFLTNCPSPYRVNFFNELSKYCDLTVLFEMEQAKNRSSEWKSDEQYQFHGVYLKSLFQKQEGAFCPEITKYIYKFRKDIIIVGGYSTPTGMYSIIYMKIHHIPFILNSDGGLIKQDSFLKRKIKTYFIGAASYWLSSGANCTKYLIHYGANVDRIYEYPFTSIRENEIGSISAERKQALREKLGIKEGKVVLFVGSFIYRKGLDILLAACKDIEDIAVVLVGGNDISEFAPTEDINYKCHIYLEGFKTSLEIKEYYQMADVLVLPTREDIWGLVVNEAMAAGLPVVATDKCNAALELVIDGKSGYIVRHEDVQELRDSLCRILENNNLRISMSKASLEISRKYTIEQMVSAHMRFLKVWNYDRGVS